MPQRRGVVEQFCARLHRKEVDRYIQISCGPCDYLPLNCDATLPRLARYGMLQAVLAYVADTALPKKGCSGRLIQDTHLS